MTTDINRCHVLSSPRQVVTCRARLIWPALTEPKSVQGSAPKYGATLIFSPGQDLGVIAQAIESAGAEKWGPVAAQMPLKRPLKDGSDRYRTDPKTRVPVLGPDGKPVTRDGFGPGTWYLSMTSRDRIDLRDRANRPVTGEEVRAMFYGGAWVRAFVNLKAYDTQGSLGIGAYCNGLQFLSHGEVLGGGETADTAFGAALPDEDGGSVGTTAPAAPPAWGAPQAPAWGAPQQPAASAPPAWGAPPPQASAPSAAPPGWGNGAPSATAMLGR